MPDSGSSVDSPQVVARSEPVLRDPVLRLIRRQHRCNDEVLIAIWMIVTAVILWLRPPVAFSSGFTPLVSTETLAAAAWTFLVVPAVLYAYLWLPDSLAQLVPELDTNGVIVGSKPAAPQRSIEDFTAEANRRIDRIIWPLIMVAFIAWYLVFDWARSDAVGAARVQEILQLVVYAPVAYASGVALGRLVSGMAIVDDLFEHYAARVRPLHPDGAGGFGPLGHRLTMVARIIGAVGIGALVINAIDFQAGRSVVSPASVFTLGAIALVGPLTVWVGIRSPHRAMLEARDDVLAPITDAIERLSVGPLPQTDDTAQATAALKGTNEEIEALHRRQKLLVDSYPVWPIHTQGFRIVVATASAPLIVGIVDVVLQRIGSIVGG